MKLKGCALRAFLWSAIYYALIIAAAAYARGNEFKDWYVLLIFVPLIALGASTEMLARRNLQIQPRLKSPAGVDLAAKGVTWIFFALACTHTISFPVCAGAAIVGAAFSFACEAVMLMRVRKEL